MGTHTRTADPAARQLVASHVRRQGDACRRLGSPLYAGLLDRVAADVEDGGSAWHVLEQFADWPPKSAYVLRVMGAANRLVLSGEAPALAPHFRPGGDAAAAWPALHQLLEERADELRESSLARPVQTNEVGRAAALAPAILRLSRGLPTRLLEVGASAGLNLCFDAYRYEDLWGPPDSPVQLVDRYIGRPPPFEPAEARIVERRGCDAHPIDVTSAEGRLTLLSFVWPDIAERVTLLEGALEVAPSFELVIDRAPAGDWLEVVLERPAEPGVATIVLESIVQQYLDAEEAARMVAAVEAAGARATEGEPVAWIRMEPDGDATRVDAVTWPGGDHRVLARSGYHGRPVRWLA